MKVEATHVLSKMSYKSKISSNHSLSAITLPRRVTEAGKERNTVELYPHWVETSRGLMLKGYIGQLCRAEQV